MTPDVTMRRLQIPHQTITVISPTRLGAWLIDEAYTTGLNIQDDGCTMLLETHSNRQAEVSQQPLTIDEIFTLQSWQGRRKSKVVDKDRSIISECH